MTTKQSTFQRLPMMLATGVLSTGLLLSGCSNNDSVETEVAMDETADVTSQDSVTTDQTTAISTTDNKNDAEQQTITPMIMRPRRTPLRLATLPIQQQMMISSQV